MSPANTRFRRWTALACERLPGEAPRFSLNPSHLANWDFRIQRMLASAHPETNGKTSFALNGENQPKEHSSKL